MDNSTTIRLCIKHDERVYHKEHKVFLLLPYFLSWVEVIVSRKEWLNWPGIKFDVNYVTDFLLSKVKRLFWLTCLRRCWKCDLLSPAS